MVPYFHVIGCRFFSPKFIVAHVAGPVSNCVHVLPGGMPIDELAIARFAFDRHDEGVRGSLDMRRSVYNRQYPGLPSALLRRSGVYLRLVSLHPLLPKVLLGSRNNIPFDGRLNTNRCSSNLLFNQSLKLRGRANRSEITVQPRSGGRSLTRR